jgi:hypothetical protein
MLYYDHSHKYRRTAISPHQLQLYLICNTDRTACSTFSQKLTFKLFLSLDNGHHVKPNEGVEAQFRVFLSKCYECSAWWPCRFSQCTLNTALRAPQSVPTLYRKDPLIPKGKRPQFLRRLAPCIVTAPTELTRLPKRISESRNSDNFCDYLPANPGVHLAFVPKYSVFLSLLEKYKVVLLYPECRLKRVKYINRTKLE